MYRIIMLIVCLFSAFEPVVAANNANQQANIEKKDKKRWLGVGIISAVGLGLIITLSTALVITKRRNKKWEAEAEARDAQFEQQNFQSAIRTQAQEAQIRALEAQQIVSPAQPAPQQPANQ